MRKDCQIPIVIPGALISFDLGRVDSQFFPPPRLSWIWSQLTARYHPTPAKDCISLRNLTPSSKLSPKHCQGPVNTGWVFWWVVTTFPAIATNQVQAWLLGPNLNTILQPSG